MAEANVAVLIDYENVGLDAIQYLLDQLSDVGRVIIKRAYADWSMQRGKQDQLLELGIEPIHQYHSNKSAKNSSDIRLAIEAIDLLYVSPVDTFVIVSSDSDFVPLVGKLHSSGKTVIGAGRRDATSTTLIKSCDRYIFLDDAKTPAQPSPQRRRRTSKADVASLVVRALEASMDDQGQVGGSKLYQTMCRIDPAFDFKAYGSRNFTQFLDGFKDVEVIRPQNRGDVLVQMAQSKPSNGTRKNRLPSRNLRRQNVQQQDDAPKNEQNLPKPQEETPKAEQTTPQPQTNGTSSGWEREIDASWRKREKDRIAGRSAAADAAKVLGVSKLSISDYPSLDKLLEASRLLQLGWRREGNAIIKK